MPLEKKKNPKGEEKEDKEAKNWIAEVVFNFLSTLNALNL